MDFPESRLAKTLRRNAENAEKTESLVLDDLTGSSAAYEGLDCRRCKTKNPLIWQRQLRSADEPMTVFYLCRNPACGIRWREG